MALRLTARLFLVSAAAIAALALAGCGGNGKKVRLTGERIPVITTEGDVQIDPILSTVPVALPRAYINPNWGQSGGNPQHVNHHLALPDTLSVAWKTKIGSGSGKYEKLVGGPIVWDGVVYVIDTKSKVSAYSADNGHRLWETTLKPKKEHSHVGYGGGVAYWGGKIFATSGYGLIAALDAGTGAVAWQVDLTVPLRGSPTVSGGQVYAISQDNQMFALSAADGTRLWTQLAIAEDAEVLGAASPAIAGDTVIAGFSSGELYALREANGLINWQDSLSRTGRLTALATLNDIDGNPVIYQGRVIAGSHSGRLVAIDLRSGERVWEANLSTLYMPWVAGSYMFLVNTEGQVFAMANRDGRVRWITQLQRFEKAGKRKDLIRWAGPVLAGDRLLVVSSSGYMLALSPYTGEIVSGVKLPGSTTIPPIVANQTLYVLTDGGELIAYR
jgi:outer membrane protein assembly factor BamB